MTGNNELYLNHATVKIAIEYYFNNVLFKTPVKVTNIAYRSNDNIFVVSVTPSVTANSNPEDSIISLRASDIMVGATKRVNNE